MGKNIQTKITTYISQAIPGLAPTAQATMLALGELIQVGPGDILFHEGVEADKCFLIISGRLKMSKLHERGKEIILKYLGPGELIAALTAYEKQPYPGTTQALEAVEVISWNREALQQLMDANPPFARFILRTALERINDIQKRYLELCAEQVDGRLARALLRIMKHAGRKTPEGILIDFPLSREDLADYVGTTVYTASRTLSAWEKKGWIKSGRERIVITDPHALMAFAEGH